MVTDRASGVLADPDVWGVVVQAVMVVNGTVWAASDSRKNGVAAGY